jgi:hypothetical protein
MSAAAFDAALLFPHRRAAHDASADGHHHDALPDWHMSASVGGHPRDERL